MSVITPTIAPTLKQHECWQALQDFEVKISCGKCTDPLECEECRFLIFIGFGGGAGGGKSWLGCEWNLTNAYRYPGMKSFIGRDELKRITQSTLITWNKVCKFHNIPAEDWRYNGQNNFIEFFNGSRIDLLDLALKPSDPDYERLGSLEYTFGWIEEAGEVKFKAFDVLKSRVGRHMNKEFRIPPKMLLTFNPNKGWLYREMYKPFKEGKLPVEYAFIRSLYRDNPHTSAHYGKMLGLIKDQATKARLKEGNWEYAGDTSVLMDYDSINDLFTNVPLYSNEIYMTVDIARFGKDKSVATIWRGMHAKRIFTKTKSSIPETTNWIREMEILYRVPRSHVCVDEDGVGGGVVDLLPGCVGFVGNSSPRDYDEEEVEETDTTHTEGRKPNYANLRSQCYFMFADEVNEHRAAILEYEVDESDPDDKKLILEPQDKEDIVQELEAIKAKDPDNDKKLAVIAKEDIKEAIGRSPDFSDSLSMRMIFELEKPKQKTHKAKTYRPKVRSRSRA